VITISKVSNDKWLTVHQVERGNRYKTLRLRKEKILFLSQLGRLITKEENHRLLVNKGSLDNYLITILELFDKYYNFKEVKKYFEVSSLCTNSGTKNREIIENNIIDILKIENVEILEYETFIGKLEGIFVNKFSFNNFMNKYIAQSILQKKYNVSNSNLFRLRKSKQVKFYTVWNTKFFYLKEDIDKYLSSGLSNCNLEEYIISGEARRLLNFKASSTFRHFCREQGIEAFQHKGRYYYFKKDIFALKKKQEYYRENYLSPKETFEVLNLTTFTLYDLSAINATPLIKSALNSTTNYTKVYLKKDVLALKNNKDLENILSTIDYKDAISAFEIILNKLKIIFSENSKLTNEEWMKYCADKLLLTKANNNTIESYISGYVKCTQILSELTVSRELYQFTVKEINLAIFNDTIPNYIQRNIFVFLKEFYPLYCEKNSENDFRRIKFKLKKQEKVFTKETYNFEVFLDVYKYVQKTEFHRKRAIEDALDIISGKKSYCYASSWLYVLVHLNNAWRHSDVINNFPKINLNDIGIFSLEELKGRDLTKDEVEKVISQIIRKDYLINKTQVLGNFYCSKDLKVPLATAAVICTLIYENIPQFSTSKKSFVESKRRIIDFPNKNREFNKKYQVIFFKNFQKEFTFESRKMNRTLLTLMYSILAEEGDGAAALKVAQRLRSHVSEETTNLYINIPREQFNFVSEQLFERESFGYIPSLLADIIFGEKRALSERTQQIQLLKKKLGGVIGIEASSGFIINMLAEEKSITDKILSLGIDQVLELNNKLKANLMPSNEDNIQCLMSETGCVKQFSESCIGCSYSIPNFYTLSILVNKTKLHLQNYKNQIEGGTNAERIKYTNILFNLMDQLLFAIKFFGENQVFNFFKDGKDEFLQLINTIGNTEDVDLNKLLTYTPQYLKI